MVPNRMVQTIQLATIWILIKKKFAIQITVHDLDPHCIQMNPDLGCLILDHHYIILNLFEVIFSSLLPDFENSPQICGNQILLQKIFDCCKQLRQYSGDLNSKHLNSGNIWVTNFYLSAIQMPAK